MMVVFIQKQVQLLVPQRYIAVSPMEAEGRDFFSKCGQEIAEPE